MYSPDNHCLQVEWNEVNYKATGEWKYKNIKWTWEKSWCVVTGILGSYFGQALNSEMRGIISVIKIRIKDGCLRAVGRVLSPWAKYLVLAISQFLFFTFLTITYFSKTKINLCCNKPVAAPITSDLKDPGEPVSDHILSNKTTWKNTSYYCLHH